MSIQPSILISQDRVLHICRLGSRLSNRVIGAFVVYVGTESEISVQIEGGEPVTARIVTVPPFKAHRIIAGRQFVKTILVEVETVSDESLVHLQSHLEELGSAEANAIGLFDLSSHLDLPLNADGAPLSSAFFDEAVFGMVLEPRALDQRVKMATSLVEEDMSKCLLTTDCAKELFISSSRFRRLFSSDTGIQFRRYKMWKRARAYLEHVRSTTSLTEIAMDLGYPDSTHFSRSIRSTYGLPPRQMKTHMQNSIFLLPR